MSLDLSGEKKPERRVAVPKGEPTHLPINDWNEDDRPREKLLKLGVQSLTNAELLAILIGSGTPQESAVALMRRVLNGAGDKLRTLSRLEPEELCAYKGIGVAKALTIVAACELGRRREHEPREQRPLLNSAQAIYEYYRMRMEEASVEEFHLLMLDNKLRAISSRQVSRGGLTATTVDLRVLLREALLAQATAIAVCHNHPSGDPRPSTQDNKLTERLEQACKLLDIRFVDHIIVGHDCYYSYNEVGKL